MPKKYQIVNDEGLVVCSDMVLQVASNVYAFLNDVYNKDILILKPMEESPTGAEPKFEKIEKVEEEEAEEVID